MSFDLQIKDGDIQLGVNNDLAIVVDGVKLLQDILKILLTPIGGNVFFPWYGSPLSGALVGTAYDTQLVGSVASTQIRNSLEALQGLQEQQMRDRRQVLTPAELIAAVASVNITQNPVDPRFFSIVARVISKAFRPVDATLNVTL